MKFGLFKATKSGSAVLSKVLLAAAVVEAGTGVGLIAFPAVVIGLFFGVEISGVSVPLSRLFGIALLALSIACWPIPQSTRGSSPARAMLVYNALLAVFLLTVATTGHFIGLMFWPAFVLHLSFTLLLIVSWNQ